MAKERYRKNRCFSTELSWPVQLEAVTPVHPEQGFDLDVKVFEDKLYGASDSDDFLFCMDIESKTILWEKEGVEDEKEVCCPIDGENGRIYCFINSCPACLDAQTGQEIWKINKSEFPLKASNKYIYCRDLEADNIPVICRSKETGEEVWRLEKIHSFLGGILVEDDVILLEGGKGIHVCRESTGEILWDVDYNSWRSQYFPGKKVDDPLLGPLINGIFYAGFSPGLLAAFQIETGELLWTNDLKSYHCPHKIIYHNGKLYFNIFQAWGTDNHLTCVDAQSGELIFKTDENFTPEGTRFPIIVNDYLVAGGGNHLSFFDLNKQEFVWRYKPKIKKNVTAFSNDLFVYKDLLISYSSSRREIYWFRSKK